MAQATPTPTPEPTTEASDQDSTEGSETVPATDQFADRGMRSGQTEAENTQRKQKACLPLRKDPSYELWQCYDSDSDSPSCGSRSERKET